MVFVMCHASNVLCVVDDVVMPWHWPSASRRCRRVVRHCASCVSMSSLSCHLLMCCASSCHVARRRHRVVRGCVVNVVMPWHWPSVSQQHHRVVRRPSTSCIVCQRVVIVVLCVIVPCHPLPLPSSCHAWTCHRHRVVCHPSTLCIVRHRVFAVSSSCPSTRCVLSCRALSCHVLSLSCMDMSSLSGRALCVMHCCVVVVVVTPWQWPSASRHCRRVAMSSVHVVRRGSSLSLLCHAVWVIMDCRCVSAGAENLRETYLQATTTCVVDAASMTQVVVGSSSSLVVGTSTMQVVGSLSFVVVAGGAGDGHCQ